MADSAKIPYKHLVVDANAIIASAGLKGMSEHYWTIPEAIAELKDARARQALSLLPFKLETKLPSDEALAAVDAFAAKTGDSTILSRTDRLLLALTYQLEKQENGLSYIRTEPPKHETKLGKPADFSVRVREHTTPECKFYRTAGGCRQGDACKFKHVPAEVDSGAAGPATAALAESSASRSATAPTAVPATTDAAQKEEAAGEEEGEDSEGEWIGPSGNEVHMDSIFPAELPGIASAGSACARRPVACITTDYAMQNTLLQQGLLLASHSGKVITTVKQWVLKCDACFTIFPASALTSASHTLFCKRCGNSTLARLGVTLGADGVPRYHYKKNRTVSTRGTIYALPKAVGGRLQDGSSAVKKELLLRPDQLLMGAWKERVRQEENKVDKTASLLGQRTIDDAMLEALGTGAGRAAARAGLMSGSMDGWIGPGAGSLGTSGVPMAAGWGRKNPNSNRTHKHRK